MTDTLLVRPAGMDDMPAIIDLIDEAAAWLRTKGTDQWDKPWPNRKARDNRVANGLRLKRTWLAVDSAGNPVATVTCRRYPNQQLWTRAEQLEPAVYVSRLIVARRHAGLGIGEALIDWAGKRAQKQWKAEWIRIDVWTTNNALREYYEKRGFIFCRELIFSDDTPWDERYPSAALFQKPIGTIHGPPAVRFAEIPDSAAPIGPAPGPDQAQTAFGRGGSPSGRGGA